MVGAMKALLGAAVLMCVSGCGGPDPKAEGEVCFGTEECDIGLTCNTGEEPKRCRPMQTPAPDAAVRIDAAPPIDADPTVLDATLPDANVPDANIPDANLPDGM